MINNQKGYMAAFILLPLIALALIFIGIGYLMGSL